jgi:hypothetical protein
MSYNSGHESNKDRAYQAGRSGADSYRSYDSDSTIQQKYRVDDAFSRGKMDREEEESRERARKNRENFISSSMNSLSSADYDQRYPTGEKIELIPTLLFFGIVAFIGLCIYLFTWINSIHTPYIPVKKILVTDEFIWLHSATGKNSIGSLKRGIPKDSIDWFLNQPWAHKRYDKKAGTNIIYLENIPQRWVKMNDGEVFNNRVWIYSSQLFQDFEYVTSEKLKELTARRMKIQVKI